MEPLIIQPNSLEKVFPDGVSGNFKPYGLYKFVTSQDEPVLDISKEIPALNDGITQNASDEFLTFTPVDGNNLYIFNVSEHTQLLIERDAQ